MANDSTSVMIGLLSSLDDKGFKDAQSEAKKMGIDLQRASDTGTVSMNKLESGSAKLRAGFVETAMKIGMAWMALKRWSMRPSSKDKPMSSSDSQSKTIQTNTPVKG